MYGQSCSRFEPTPLSVLVSYNGSSIKACSCYVHSSYFVLKRRRHEYDEYHGCLILADPEAVLVRRSSRSHPAFLIYDVGRGLNGTGPTQVPCPTHPSVVGVANCLALARQHEIDITHVARTYQEYIPPEISRCAVWESTIFAIHVYEKKCNGQDSGKMW